MTMNCCAYCKVTKPGRFTRPKTATSSGWSHGFTLPVWACYDCLPLGDGRGETTNADKDERNKVS